MYRQTFREAFLIVLVASALGLSYSAITKRGIFGKPLPDPKTAFMAQHSLPEMVKLEGARELFESGNSLFIDSRHEFDYRMGHIRGAINIPVAEFDKQKSKLTDIPKNKSLVVYCDGAECNSSFELAGKLFTAGYRNVNIFFSGWQDWKSNGLPTESSHP